MHASVSARNPAVIAIVASFLMAGCFGIGACSETEAFAFNALQHYGDEDLVPEAQASGACGASLVTGDDPDVVIEHYRSELERVGFAVDPAESSPMVDESGAVIGRTVSIHAVIETATASVSAEVLDGQDTIFVILVDEVH
jgi:hypothetical protein